MAETKTELTGYMKLVGIQRELAVLKTQYNEHGKYYYRSTEDILLALKPMLAKHEMTLTMSDGIVDISGCAYVESNVILSDELGFEASASSVARDSMSNAANISLAPIATNAASSFARKQALSGLFLIDDSAMIPMSKDEQEEVEEKTKEMELEQERAKAEKLKEQEVIIEQYVADAKKAIEATLSLKELQAIYQAMYRGSKQYGTDIIGRIETLYRTKKGDFSETV